MNTLLSLFDYTGNWSQPYEEAGWNVIRIDRKIKQPDYFADFNIDIADINTDWLYDNIFDNYESLDVVLCAPPCTDFAVSGAKHWAKKAIPEQTLFGEVNRLDYFINLSLQCLRVIDLCKPQIWVIENPVGRISSLIPALGKGKYFQPYQYGDSYSKKTGLWGKFTMPEPTNIVAPEKGKHGSRTQKLGGKSERTKELRSITPMGFAKAFYQANHNIVEYTDEFIDNFKI